MKMESTTTALWPAIFRGRVPVDLHVEIPGSKSVTNRALILAAQAKSPSTIRKPLISRDSQLMVAGLQSLGVKIEERSDGSWIVNPSPLRGPATIDVGNAGTVMRFLPPLAALAQGEIAFDGDPRSYERPLGPVISALEELGIDFGATVTVDRDAQRWSVAPGDLPGVDLVIEPDLSNAAPFLSLAMVCGGSVTIADWPRSTTQPGDQLREIFTRMGATVEFVNGGLKLTGGESIHGIDIDLHDVGELTPSIAALAALADSPSHLRGIAHLRLHETDRLAALTREINGLGGSVTEEESVLHIDPTKGALHSGTFHTYEDHRLATAGAVIGLVVADVLVENIATTRKTLPDFPGLWSSLLQ